MNYYKKFFVLLVIFIVSLIAISCNKFTSLPFYPVSKDDLIIVDTPLPNSAVSSPIFISGQARGRWYFEAQFSIKIYDANEELLGVIPAQAQGEWMTNEYVPFQATLSFESSTTPTGKLVLEKDNPSGLPENANELIIPIVFSEVTTSEQTVKLYYYNSSKDTDEKGNILCSKEGLVAVERKISVSKTPIQDTIKLLIEGDLSLEEKDQGLSTEYPLSGFELNGASLNNGVLALDFLDPENKTSGGSCRVTVLWLQIQATAKQFPEVKEVKFIPQDLFQP